MISCPKCFTLNQKDIPRCATCGTSLIGISEEQNQETIHRFRLRNRLRGHMLTGAILCFGLPTVFGLPSSLFPTQLLINAVFGIAFGVPLGLLVSKYANSITGGAAIGCGIGIVYAALQMLIFNHQLSWMAILVGIGTGIVPGGIMGWHVEQDR